MKNRLLNIFVFVLVFASYAYAQIYTTESTPSRIILNLTDNPSSSMAVTWRTVGKVENPQVKIAETTGWVEIDSTAAIINAKTERLQIDSNVFVYHHSAVLTGLNPNTQYSFKVGSGKEWSEWNQFTTASDEAAPFHFIFFADPQNDVKEFVSRIFRKGFATAPDARFWLFTGDLTDRPLDNYWDELFYAGGFVFSMTPSILAPGSHEYGYKKKDGTRVKGFTPLWNAHFTLPQNGIAGLEERSYYLDYQGVRIIMLDAQSELEKQAVWLDKILSQNNNKWTIIAMHEPLFSMGRNRDERNTRNAFMTTIDKYSVDLVLTGHDHVYSRSKKLKNMEIVKDTEPGTVYVVSDCGGKSYELSDTYSALMAKTGDDVQLFQVISLNGTKLELKTFSITGELYDSFELRK